MRKSFLGALALAIAVTSLASIPARIGRAADGPTEKPPLAKNDREQKILNVLADINSRQRRGNMLVPEKDGRLLRMLVVSTGAKHVVEVGTSAGYSGIWFCLGLLDTGGKLTTHELDPRRAALARENFKRAGVDHLVTLVEGDAHETVTRIKEPIDILFLDADKEGYIDYLKKLLPHVRPGGLILAHNTTNLRSSLLDYIELVTSDPKLETLFLNEEPSGIAVTLKKP